MIYEFRELCWDMSTQVFVAECWDSKHLTITATTPILSET